MCEQEEFIQPIFKRSVKNRDFIVTYDAASAPLITLRFLRKWVANLRARLHQAIYYIERSH